MPMKMSLAQRLADGTTHFLDLNPISAFIHDVVHRNDLS